MADKNAPTPSDPRGTGNPTNNFKMIRMIDNGPEHNVATGECTYPVRKPNS